ncbi:MAG: indole-3-glycerol phosphate synthase TrpC [Actinomycetota bacterium]
MSYLEDLVTGARRRAADLGDSIGVDELADRAAGAAAPRGFAAALRSDHPALIAEIKRATPRGELNPDLDAAELADLYARGGASAISVLTEPDYFKGSMDDLVAARPCGLPVVRKDFIVDEIQILEARAAGADAVLAIVRILGDEFETILESAAATGMDALVEVHDETDLARAVDAGASLIGVNHRDLATFEVDPDRTAKLVPLMPGGATVVALSAVRGRADVERLIDAGAHAVLVGEALVTAPDPVAKIRELLKR